MKICSGPDSPRPKLQSRALIPSSFRSFISSTSPFPNRIDDELITTPSEPSRFPHPTPKPSLYPLLISCPRIVLARERDDRRL